MAEQAGVSRKTIRKGIPELEAGEIYEPGARRRKQGGGRKQVTSKDATLRADWEELLTWIPPSPFLRHLYLVLSSGLIHQFCPLFFG